jgi:heme exporter protein C
LEDIEKTGRRTGAYAADKSGWRLTPRSVVGIIAGVLMLVDLYMIFVVAPTDANLGNIQRVFYLHVPIALMSFLAFFIVFVGSVMYLIKRINRWDSMALAAGEVGVVFVTLALITGVIWAKPVWNVWWTWEPRLTTTLVLWLIYVGYLMVRAYAPNRSKAAVYSAVVGIIGFVDVPIVYYSVQWWRSIHPNQVVGPLAESGSLSGTMSMVLLVSSITFLFLTAWLILERMAARDAEDELGRIRFELRRSGQAPDA